jgi:type IV secretory pathway ATPase VirB11/archaellum biosynthesis ATPase
MTVHTIERVFEINPTTARYVGFTTKKSSEVSGVEIGMPDILRLNLRMRPDCLIVDEIRTAEDLKVFLDVAGTGHSGLTTINASDLDRLLMRLKAMGIDPAAAEKLWGCAIIKVSTQGTNLRRRVVVVADFTPINGEIEAEEVINWEPSGDVFEPADPVELFMRSPRLKTYCEETGVSRDEIVHELSTKMSLIEKLGKTKI